MKYEIEVDGYQKELEVRSDEDGYHITIDGVVHDVEIVKNQGNSLFLRMGAQMMAIEHAFCHDMQEIHYKGQRYVASVMDPRKKVLQLASASGGDNIITQMPGRVISIRVAIGDVVQKGHAISSCDWPWSNIS